MRETTRSPSVFGQRLMLKEGSMIEFVTEARGAILIHFLSLDAIAWTSRREVAFVETLGKYGDAYRQARTELITAGCIDVPRFGFLRLTEVGYLEALEWVALL
jgi:hypothetical protein